MFKLAKKAKKDPSVPLPYPFTYISHTDRLLSIKGRGKSVAEIMDLDVLEEALAVRAAIMIRDTVDAMA